MKIAFNTPIFPYASKSVSDFRVNPVYTKGLAKTDSVSFCASPNYTTAKKIWSTLENSNKIAIITHKYPDPDAISSGLLLLELLEKKFKNKVVDFLIKKERSNLCSQIPNINKIKIFQEKVHKNYDTVVVLDCDERLVDCEEILASTHTKINIDHHKRPRGMSFFNPNLTIIESRAVSTTQVLFDNFLFDFGNIPTPTMAECIMTGVISDSGNFQHIHDSFLKKFNGFMYRFKSVTPNSVSELKQLINEKFRKAESQSSQLQELSYKIVKEGLNTTRIKTPENLNVQYVKIDRNLINSLGIKDNDAEIKRVLNHIANYNTKVSDISAIIWEKDNGNIKVSLRSRNYGVLPIVEKLNGGGHNFAAGTVLDCDIDSAVEQVLNMINRHKFLKSKS